MILPGETELVRGKLFHSVHHKSRTHWLGIPRVTAHSPKRVEFKGRVQDRQLSAK